MNQQKIKYHQIIALGFNENPSDDSVYFNEFGFEYVIITLQLSKYIFIDWAKETQLCKMVRINKASDIVAEMPIKDLEQLKEIINFFKSEKSNNAIFTTAC